MNRKLLMTAKEWKRLTNKVAIIIDTRGFLGYNLYMLTLLDKVKNYKSVDLRFHTPSHSFDISDELYSNAKYDVTELSFSDNLLYPKGVIRELELELEKIYKTRRTLVITAGATTGNFIGLNVLKNYGKVLVTSNCHKSIFSACRLFDIDAEFMEDVYYDNGLPRPTTIEDIEKYLTPDIKSVVLTSPTYFGDVVSVGLIKTLQNRGLFVMVDEAHGGHFAYSNLLPTSLANIADIVVDSVHKTLPVYTGGALIHINNSSLVAESELYHSLLHTSSPNYVTMCSIDYSQDLFCRKGEELYSRLFEVVQDIKLDKFKVVKTDDFSRLVIDTYPYDAECIQGKLEEQSVFIEMSYKHFLVLILSPLNVCNVKVAVDKINKVCLDNAVLYVEDNAPKSTTSNVSGSVELIKIEDSTNRISGSEVGIYPPGVPVIKTGDIITAEQVEYLLKNKDRLFGLTDNKIFVIRG